jgi:hypothetical protein
MFRGKDDGRGKGHVECLQTRIHCGLRPMTQRGFDHQKLDVYRYALALLATRTRSLLPYT